MTTEIRPGSTRVKDSEGDELLIDANGALVAVIGDDDGARHAHLTNHRALLVAPPPESKTSGGEALFVQPTPQAQLSFIYSINPDQVIDFSNGGTVTQADSMAILSTGAAANQSAAVASYKEIRAEAGIGARGRFSGMFTTGVANSTQMFGLTCGCEGMAFGYNGATFGILHRTAGEFEIRTLTVTTKSTTAENITITLDGDADATVAVTDATATDATTTANEIAAHDFSDLGRGWFATAVGDTVVFMSYFPASRTGAYTLSGATTAVGTVAQSVAGTAPTDNWVAQASWNGNDKFDGAGISGVTLDPTKGNAYQVDFQDGFDAIRYYVRDPEDGEFHLVHTVQTGNNAVVPPFNNPTFPLLASCENLANTTDLVMKVSAMSSFIDGKPEVIGIPRGVSTKTTLAAATETPVLSIRLSEAFLLKRNRSRMVINLANVSVAHNKPCTMIFYRNLTLVGASFSAYSANSTLQIDTAATAFSGGAEIFAVPLGQTGQETVNLLDDKLIAAFGPGDTLTVTALPESGTGALVAASFNLTERL